MGRLLINLLESVGSLSDMGEAALQGVRILGESAGFWVQTTAILITGIAALATIVSNKINSQQRATIDLILHQKIDVNLIEAKKIWSEVKNNEQFEELACKENEKDTQRRPHILNILNNYEFIALGVRTGAFHEKTYKRAFYGVLTRDWDSCEAFITALRRQQGSETLFQEFEALAKKWKKKPLKKN